MSAFLYGLTLQWKLDIRSKTLLVTCYIVPLLFFALMGGIFTSINPEMKSTLIQSMIVMSVSMGALIGLPPTIVETCSGDIKKAYKANGVPLYVSLVAMFISTFVHLMLVSAIIFFIAPVAFEAALPTNFGSFFLSLAIFVMVSLSIGCVLGVLVKKQAKLTMIAQIIFLPSIMLSGIMFPINLLPKAFEVVGKIFPAAWGYRLMLDNGLSFQNLWAIIIIFLIATLLTIFLLKKQGKA